MTGKEPLKPKMLFCLLRLKRQIDDTYEPNSFQTVEEAEEIATLDKEEAE